MAKYRDELHRLYSEARAALRRFDRACRELDADTDAGRARTFEAMKFLQSACKAFMDYGTANRQ